MKFRRSCAAVLVSSLCWGAGPTFSEYVPKPDAFQQALFSVYARYGGTPRVEGCLKYRVSASGREGNVAFDILDVAFDNSDLATHVLEIVSQFIVMPEGAGSAVGDVCFSEGNIERSLTVEGALSIVRHDEMIQALTELYWTYGGIPPSEGCVKYKAETDGAGEVATLQVVESDLGNKDLKERALVALAPFIVVPEDNPDAKGIFCFRPIVDDSEGMDRVLSAEKDGISNRVWIDDLLEEERSRREVR